MLTPYQLPLFVRYLDGIDLAVSRRLLRPVAPSETTLTQEFCALMDAGTQRREASLLFDAEALQTALARPGDMVDVHISIETHQHGPRLEAYVSQSDFGLILDYENTVLPKFNWKAAYLMQAKRLFPQAAGGYGLASAFTSISAAQRRRMHDLEAILGSGALRYWLYMPPTQGYDPTSAAAIRALHTRNLSGNIFDYALGLALRDALAYTGGIDAGLWTTGLDAGDTALEIHEAAFSTAHPFTWFILAHFSNAPSNFGLDGALNSDDWGSAGMERVASIAAGDRQAAQALIDELGKKARDPDFDPATMTVLPAHSVTIKLRSGPRDGIDLPIATRDRY